MEGRQDFFICDSGATAAHMMHDKSRLHDLQPTERNVKVGNGETVKGEMIGKLTATVKDKSGHELVTTLSEVVYVPKLMCNLLSVGKLREHGSVVYDRKGAELRLQGRKEIIPFEKLGGMEVFGIELRKKEEAMVAMPESKPVGIAKAHGVLGHIGMDSTRETMKYWGWKVTKGAHTCEECIMAKARQKNVKKVRSHGVAKSAGERLFIDISSVAKTSAGGKKFWALIVDDQTRMKWSRFLGKKSDLRDEVLPLIKRLIATGREVKKVRMDNAGENRILGNDLKEMGLQVEYVAPNTPQQNGVVERAFATCTARGRAMMKAAGLSEQLKGKLWAECFQTAVVLSNLVPFQHEEEKKEAPYHRFYGKDKEPGWLRHMS